MNALCAKVVKRIPLAGKWLLRLHIFTGAKMNVLCAKVVKRFSGGGGRILVCRRGQSALQLDECDLWLVDWDSNLTEREGLGVAAEKVAVGKLCAAAVRLIDVDEGGRWFSYAMLKRSEV